MQYDIVQPRCHHRLQCVRDVTQGRSTQGFLLESGPTVLKSIYGDPAQIENDPSLQEGEIVIVHLSPFQRARPFVAADLKLIASARSRL